MKEQFISGINDGDMMIKIIRELITIKNTNEITREQVLYLGRIVGVKRFQKAILDHDKRKQMFNAIKYDQENNATGNIKGSRKVTQSNCRYNNNKNKPQRFQPMARTVQSTAEQIVSGKCGESTTERCQEIATEKSPG